MQRSVILLVILSVSLLSYTQINTQNSPTKEKRIALLIGNGTYNAGMLLNPENDARAMKTALLQLGFEIMEYENLNQNQMKRVIDEFGFKMKNYDVGLFFYAGHGIQSKGINYLIPVDADLFSEIQVEYDCVQADRVVSFMEESGAKVKIIILDACRNNPFERSWTRTATGRGLATMNAPSGTLIAYATSPGSTASDGAGTNGLYTSAILENIIKPDITILQMFQNVRATVSDISNKQQIPWESTSLIGDFYFNTTSNKSVSYTEEKVDNLPAKREQEKPAETTTEKFIPDEYLIRNSISNIRIVNILKSPDINYSDKTDTVLTAVINQGRNKGIKKGSVIEVFDSLHNTTSLSNKPAEEFIYRIGTIYIESSKINSSEGELIMKNSSTTDYEHYDKMLCKHKKLFNTIYGLATASSEPHTGGIGLGYMIYKNWGGYVEFDTGRNTEDILACSLGIVKELTRNSSLRLGYVLGPYLLAINAGGVIRIKNISVIYGCHIGTEGLYYFDFDYYGMTLGLGYVF